MRFIELREELKSFYWQGDRERSKSFAEKCFEILDNMVADDMSVQAQKLMQYDVIAENFEPEIFKNCPFYYETGALSSLSDGCRHAKGYGHLQAGGWTFNRNKHQFEDQAKELFELRYAQSDETLYLICGAFNDDSQHFNFNNRPILEGGLKGVYESAKNQLKNAATDEEREFLDAVCHSMLVLKKMAEKFALKAKKMAETETNPKHKENLSLIAKTASDCPWEAPETFYEALNTLAFMRTALGTLEGVGPNTFGRVDMDLYPFYKSDLEKGIITKDGAYQLICKFLIIWDMHYDHNMEMKGYADHELENTYVLGGCDKDGNPLYNELTQMFLQANREEKIIFPKIKCRYSSNSPKEYLDEINSSVLGGTSTILFQNDEASVAALINAGRPVSEARDYIVSGCWGFATYQEKFDHGSYVNLLKPFEFALHNLTDKIQKVQIDFKTFEDCKTFEDIYGRVVYNSRKLIEARIDIVKKCGYIINHVDRFPLFSSTLEDCIKNRADYTLDGGRYRDDYLLMFGLPNIVDSLLAIKSLVFDQKKYTLKQMLDTVRNNWEDNEDMRIEAMKCCGWGDGSEESCALACRFNNDLYKICQSLEGSYGGKVNLGHITYTEIRWWGQKTLATPDGRKNGDYFSQGLTPSRLKKIPSVTAVIDSMASLDPKTLGANSVVNIILPSNKMNLDLLESFLRATAKTAVQSLQLNCVSKEDLLDAQIHPENHQDLIVRVTGFSAKFTSLSKGWQDEFLTRNYYE